MSRSNSYTLNLEGPLGAYRSFLIFLCIIFISFSFYANAKHRIPAEEFVIPADAEAVFRKIGSQDCFALPDWTISAISIKVVSATITVTGPSGQTFELELVHPDTFVNPLARTAKFAIVARGDVTDNVLETLQRCIRSAEVHFEWLRRVSPSAVPVHNLNRVTVNLPDDISRRKWEEAIRLAESGDAEAALTAVNELVRLYQDSIEVRRAAAAVARIAGDGRAASNFLKLNNLPQGDFRRLYLELAASIELLAAKEGSAIDKMAALAIETRLASEYPRLYPDVTCARADALTILLQEGRIGEVSRALTDIDASRCMRLLAIKVAMARGNDAEVDEASKAALKDFPDDTDVLFIWGTHYYNKAELHRAVEIWDRLAEIEPDYPTLLGQYGTAYLVSGRLDWKTTDDLLALTRKNPDDLVANYLAAIGLYYVKDYVGVIPLLTRVVNVMPEEPRARMYLAMASFFAGDAMKALLMMEALDDFAYQEPDIYYCRSLIYRSFDLERAIREMERFIEVFEGQKRLRFGEQKVRKAKSDLELMKKGVVPDVSLPPEPVIPEVPPPR